MIDKKLQSGIHIKGSVYGIGNVIGSNSLSHVEINFSLFNRMNVSEEKTEIERNPKFTADIGYAFFPHPDKTLPELDHLIGHQAMLQRLAELYDYARRENKGAFVFLTGNYGYGAKALGRTFIDALRLGSCRTAITRFWPEQNEIHTRRDGRWNSGFQRWQEIFENAPDFLKQDDIFPIWGVIFQMMYKIPWLEHEPLPTRHNDLPAYFRKFTQSGEPLVILLEDFEFASAGWVNLLRYLSKEAKHSLPILWIVTMHSRKPIDQFEGEYLTQEQSLALELAQQDVAEIYHLSRITQQDVTDYIAPAQDSIAERLHRLTCGVPILIQNLWEDWRRANVVIFSDEGQWIMDRSSPWAVYGSGRDFVRDKLETLWANENAPWSVDQMYEMLKVAAQEGPIFTVAALANTFDLDPEILSKELEYLLDDEDDLGILQEAEPLFLQMSSAGWIKTLERYKFYPILGWFMFTEHEKPDSERFIRYAEGLRQSVWPFIEHFSSIISYLYEQANQPELSRKYRQITEQNNALSQLMNHADLLLEFPEDEISQSRLYGIGWDLYTNHYVTIKNSQWACDFAARLEKVFEASNAHHFLGLAFLLRASAKQSLGEYAVARNYFEKMLATEEKLERKEGVAAALGGLGEVSRTLGEYASARGYFEKMLAIEEELGLKDGVAAALGGLGEVSQSLGEYTAARDYYEKQLSIDEELGRKDGVAFALGGLGEVTLSLCEYATARGYFEKQLYIFEELGRKDGIAHALRGLGDVAQSIGEYAAARNYYERQLAIDEELGLKDGIAFALKGLGEVSQTLGEYVVARGYYEKMLALFEEVGRKDGVAFALIGMGQVSCSLGEHDVARSYYEKGLSIEEELGRKDGIATALGGLGQVAESLGEYAAAQGYYEKMLQINESLGRKGGISFALGGLGHLAESRGEYVASQIYYERMLVIEEGLGRKDGTMLALGKLGVVSQLLGEYVAARDYYGKMLTIVKELGRKDFIAAALGGLGQVAQSLGEYEVSLGYYERMLEIYESIGSPDAKRIRDRIEQLDKNIRSKNEPETSKENKT